MFSKLSYILEKIHCLVPTTETHFSRSVVYTYIFDAFQNNIFFLPTSTTAIEKMPLK